MPAKKKKLFIDHKKAKKMDLFEIFDLVYETIRDKYDGFQLPLDEVEELNKTFPGYPNSPFNFDQWTVIPNKEGNTLVAHTKKGQLIPFATYLGTLGQYFTDQLKKKKEIQHDSQKV